jgi:hypothetical protein
MKRTVGLKRGLGIAAGMALALGLAACSRPEAPKTAEPAKPAVDWSATVNEWIESDFKANPSFAFYEGRVDYAGQLPDFSEAGLAAEIKRLHDWKTRIEGIDTTGFTDAQKFERDYFLAYLDGQIFWQETADWPHKNPEFYGLDPSVYFDRPYADLAKRMKDYTLWASNVPKAIEQIKANLSKAPIPAAYVDIGEKTIADMGGFLRKEVPGIYKGAGDKAAQDEFAKANKAAADAFDSLKPFFKGLEKTQTKDFAMGPDLFAKMIYATERVDTPLDQLEAIGEADLKRNLDALAEACKAFAPGKTTKECIAKAAADKPPGGDFVGYATKQLVELRQFVKDHNVVTIPSDDQAKVKQAPAYNAQNSAYIDTPPPFGDPMPAFYNIAAPDPSWSKAEQAAYIPSKGDLLFTSVHEVWPGHFLQFLHSNRSPSIFGKVYVGYAFAEGWAHYAEEMMWDEGLGNGDPETHIGQLTNALLRNVRFISAIGMHTKGMTLDQSRQMFLDDAFQDAGNARQQSARGAYDPAYLNYTMGKLMIRKLRDDWCAKKGAKPDDKTCWRDFHDAFLAFGGPPIPLVRGAMMGEPAKSVF